jgi:hypothetical protein
LQVRRIKHPLDVLIVAAAVAAFFVPLISIPVWASATGTSTRRLGRNAIDYYQQTAASADLPATVRLPSPPTARIRRRFVVSLVVLVAALAAVAPFIPLGKVSHFLPLGGIVLAEAALVWTGLRLIFITRPASPIRPEWSRLHPVATAEGNLRWFGLKRRRIPYPRISAPHDMEDPVVI